MSNHKKAYLEITNCCNLNCAFCPGTTRAPRFISESEFKLLASKLSFWAEYLYYHLMGEPLSHPLLPRFIKLAHGMGFKSVITTNGTLLAERGEELISAKPYKVSISLHSFEANESHVPFHEYISSCLDFAACAADAGIITVLRLWNLEGKAAGALNTKNDGILALAENAFPTPWEKTRTGQKLSDRVFLEWGDKFDWPKLTGPVFCQTGFCYGLRDQLGVLCDGTVVPCCLDSNGDIMLGNLFEQSVEDVLSSPRAKKLYDGFSSHICTEELCKRCMRASYYRQNKI